MPVFHTVELPCDSQRSAASTPEVVKDQDRVSIGCHETSAVRPESCTHRVDSEELFPSLNGDDMSFGELQQLRYACSKLLTRTDEIDKDDLDDIRVVDVKKAGYYFKNRHMKSNFQNFSSKLVRNKACLDLKGLVAEDDEKMQDQVVAHISKELSVLRTGEIQKCNDSSIPMSKEFQDIDVAMDHSADIWKISCSLNIRVPSN